MEEIEGFSGQFNKKPGRKGKAHKVDSTSSTDRSVLTERQRDILKIIVQAFVTTATPISSEMVVYKYRLPVSTATVRNEMAELEHEGFITHPHTSAGRVPSDKGYRYYVEHLMERSTGLTIAEKHTIQHQFYQIQLEMNEWLRLAASVTARTAQNAAVVSGLHSLESESRLKHVQLIEIQERLVLMVLVTQQGTIKEQMLSLEEPSNQEELSVLSNRLNARLTTMNAFQVEGRLVEWSEGLARYVVSRIAETLRGLDQRQESQLYREGLSHILSQPEFSDIVRVRQVLETIESGAALTTIIPEVIMSEDTGVQIIIGGENRYDDLRLLSVVLARYGIDGQWAGVVGIVGPTRMEYGRSISTVQYISELLTTLVSERRG
jgi:heat-inducible transcriptional repressor